MRNIGSGMSRFSISNWDFTVVTSRTAWDSVVILGGVTHLPTIADVGMGRLWPFQKLYGMTSKHDAG